MSLSKNTSNWEMPVSKVPNCKWNCSHPEKQKIICWDYCRNQKNITKDSVIKIIEL